ncbi:MAG TPA: energy-coupling factor transporter transmembrane protein EcfT [Candidatus Bathyarchaeota archaeon]|nr:energy-coupling factor transporter transmembrane protein EcfT [Candidatus Bathyarchaeota archaeon]
MRTRFIRYIEGKSVIHRLDPRSKLIFVFSILLSLTVAPNILFLIPLLAVSLAFYFSARLPWSKTKTTWKFVLAIILVLSTLNLLTLSILYGGAQTLEDVIAQLTSKEVLLKSLTPVTKLLTLAIATVTFIFTTPPHLYAPALGQMGVPYKVAYIVQLALRYIPEYIDEMKKTLEAQMARGFRPKGGKNPIARILSVVPLVVPVTISATLSIYDIADAMELRGFGEKRCHTWYRKLRMMRRDKLLIMISIALAAIYVAIFLMRLYGVIDIPTILRLC